MQFNECQIQSFFFLPARSLCSSLPLPGSLFVTFVVIFFFYFAKRIMTLGSWNAGSVRSASTNALCIRTGSRLAGEHVTMNNRTYFLHTWKCRVCLWNWNKMCSYFIYSPTWFRLACANTINRVGVMEVVKFYNQTKELFWKPEWRQQNT